MMTTFIHSILFGKKPCDVRDPLGKTPVFFRLSFAFLLLLFFSINGNSQGSYDTASWRFSNPKQLGFSINDLDYVDDNNVIAVGTDGGIAKSINAGASWTYGPFTYLHPTGVKVKATFNDVHYVSPNIAYAVGTGGCMAKTTDGGKTWSFVNNPLFANSRIINTVWFVNDNKGYIGGEWNTLDSIPKVYFTNNGGATWDSLVSPSGLQTRYGYINNPNVPAQFYTVTGKGKEIRRIMFFDENTGFISGNGSFSSGSVPTLISPTVTSTVTCLPTGANTTILAVANASLIWKFSNGTLMDYSATKEKLGYPGIPTGTINCTTRYTSVTLSNNNFSSMHIINDSVILLISSTGTVMKVYAGRNDSTLNVATGLKDAGRYEVLNATNTQGGYPTIPAVNPLFSLNGSFQIRKASNGKLFVPVSSSPIAPANRMMTSVDTGRTWVEERNLPNGTNYSNYNAIAIDISPSGKFLVGGTNGVVADSLPGGAWNSTYVTVNSAAAKFYFADCNHGIAVGGAQITITTDGGKTWIDRNRGDLAALNQQIRGFAYVNPSKAYFVTSLGTVYSSADINIAPPATPTLDPIYANSTVQMIDIATIGNDSIWVIANDITSIPIATRSSKVFRSVNGGLNWTIHGNFPVGVSSALSLNQTLTDIEFPSRQVGYVAGNKDTIWKTTDAGATWLKLPLPFPGVTPQVTYTDMYAVDENTVFLVGQGAFPRKVVIKTTDGGATWIDITNNILTSGAGNLNSVIFHDANNGYVAAVGGYLFKTTNGGASWTLDIAPSGIAGEAIAFAPRTVPAGISFANRKLFTTGQLSSAIMEYGNPLNVNVNSTETVVNATCTNLTAGSITLNTTGGLAPYTYSINGGAFQTSNVFNGLTQGAKTITVKDAFCGTLTKTVNVGFTDNMTVTANNDTTVCTGTTVQMTAAAPVGSTFAWAPSAGLTNPAISNPVATINTNTTYTVTATLGGCVKTDNVVISTKPSPTISAGPDKTVVDGDKVQLQGSANNAVSVAWTPANTLTDANTFFPTAKPTATTTYTLTVRNSDNCTSTDNVLVTVIPYCIKVMNAFTPNGDGTNDKWIVTNGTACTNSVKVRVFNRYGQEVYKNDNYQNNWDGLYGGKPIPDGTYYYTIDFHLINGRTAVVKGDVTILR